MATASVAADRVVGGSDLALRAVYRQASDSVTLEETWKVDANNKLVGRWVRGGWVDEEGAGVGGWVGG